jgi:protein TonB
MNYISFDSLFWRRLAAACFVGVAGSAGVLGLMLLMNEFSSPPPEKPAEPPARFSVPTPEPRDKPEPPEKKKRRKPQPREQAAPPPPLGLGVGTLDLGIDAFDFARTKAAAPAKTTPHKAKSSVMNADSVDQRPVALHRVEPQLSRRLISKQIEGIVVVKALIDESGRIADVRVIAASPKGVFEKAVLNAVRRWRFRPAQFQGRPVKTWVEIPFHFQLS